eukprot:c22704_g1_i1 orf=237-2081(-)
MGADMEEGNFCGFEGFEKRLEVEFGEESLDGGMSSNAGLRSLSRCELDEMLTAAECTIVSEKHNKWFDAYVLSESSLFVYPRRVVLKTCGRTRLLNVVPILLQHAAALSLHAIRCKYSRGTFIFPQAQPFPYTSFTEETRVLDKLFAPMLMQGSRSAHVLNGHPGSGSSSWHIYTATAAGEYMPAPMRSSFNAAMAAGERVNTSFPSPIQTPSNMYTLEMCMTHLHRTSASHFMNSSGIKSGEDMTHDSGISSILPNALISDFAFTPCGYSMNGMEEDALSTIHITPEEGHSYASFEVMGYDPHSLDLQALVNRVVAGFLPGSLVMSIHASNYSKGRHEKMPSSWSTSHVVPKGYACNSSVRQELAGHGVVAFHTFTRCSSTAECGVIPQPLWLNSDQVDESDTDGVHVTSNEPSPAAGNDDGDGMVMPLLRQKGSNNAVFELEDNILEMVVKENPTLQAQFNSPFNQFTRNASDVAPYRDAYAELKAHQSVNSYEFINHGGALLTIVDVEMDLSQLQGCYLNAKVILKVRPVSKGCPDELSPNAEELLRKSKKLGVQVVGIAVDLGLESCTAVCAYKGAIRAAREVCGTAKALGLPPLKLLAMGQRSSTLSCG